MQQAEERFYQRIQAAATSQFIKYSAWLQENFWVPEPRNIETGAILRPGPIQLASHQCEIIDEALSRDPDTGMLKYTTILYSAPKKSGKSAIAAGVALATADMNPFSYVYLLANDKNQSDNRLYWPIYTCMELQRNARQGRFMDMNPNLGKMRLTNGTFIEAVAVDAAGEAGAEPLATFWSELWGFDTPKKKKLWTEMTVPPTKWGRAYRWVESYAGYRGVSELLENLHRIGVTEATPHPMFEDMRGRDNEPVVWINEKFRIFAYWDTAPRMIWQNEDYYQEQAGTLPHAEFERVHHNQWISPVGVFVDENLWMSCADDRIPELTDAKTPLVVVVDAATENDCAAIYGLTRHPFKPDTDVAIRMGRIFRPAKGQPINLTSTVGVTIQEWCMSYNVVCVVFDSFQMKKMVQDYRKGIIELPPEILETLNSPDSQAEELRKRSRAVQTWYYEFKQGSDRAKADKQLYDMIVTRQLHWRPNTQGIDLPNPGSRGDTLCKHIAQAGAKINDTSYRIMKLSDDLKIDAAVAISMGVDRCMALQIENYEFDERSAEQSFEEGTISYDDYMRLVAQAHVRRGQ